MILKVHSHDEVSNYKTQFGEWKIQLKIAINFISSKDSKETRTMHKNSDNIEIMMNIERDDIMNELFRSLLQKYQEGLEESMRGSLFILDSVDLDHTKNLLNGYKIIKATINPQNYDDGNCSQYSFTVALNHKRIKNHPEKISNIKPFINPNGWKEIDILPRSKDWKKLEQNNKTIALNIYMCHTILNK